jgi:flavin prenyltransferase
MGWTQQHRLRGTSVKIVLAITGASGSIYAVQLIKALTKTMHSVDMVASKNALQIARDECDVDLNSFAYPLFENNDFKAPFASGSAHYDAMLVVPCSMGMLGRIAHGYSENLIARTADVFLKEKRPLILVPRETPYNLVQIENMRLLVLAGATILPACPSFYSSPQTIEAVVDTVVARLLDHLKIDNALRPRYGNISND